MTRYHTTSKGNIPFTAEEEAEWDAMEAEWAAGADERAATEIKQHGRYTAKHYETSLLRRDFLMQ